MIPLLRDHLKRAPRLFYLSWFELPQSFASDFNVAHQARVREDAQMFRDGLARDIRSTRELRYRHPFTSAEHDDETQTRLIPERREDRRRIPHRLLQRHRPGRFATAWRQVFRCFEFVRPNPHCSCEMRPDDAMAAH